jgi:chemotaxis protein methyltransferase CheR
MEAWEYSYIRREILQLTGVDLSAYKGAQMQRRLAAYLLKSGHPNWRSLFNTIRGAPNAVDALKNYLTINVSAFFRDTDKYDELRERILPELLRQRAAPRIWSAGCSRGQEPYSLAMLLRATCRPDQRYHVLATDLDSSALDWARAGGPYTAEDIAGVPPELARRYLSQCQDGWWVSADLRRQISFRQHDLLRDTFDTAFDLIVCRNVTIYFTGETREALYQRFHTVLRPGGILFVGGTEVVSRSLYAEYETIGVSFYRRK